MEMLLATLAGLITQTPITTEYIASLISRVTKKKLDGNSAMILSWVVGIGSTMFAAWTNVDLFLSWPFAVWWQQGLLYGVIVSGCANGLFRFEIVKKILVIVRARKK